MQFLTTLHRPYPIAENKWKIIVSVSLFITFFMLIFQPFGLQRFDSQIKPLILGGYGLITFSILILNLIVIEQIFKKTFSEEKWTTGKQIIWLMWILFSIGLANFFYSQAMFNFTHNNIRVLYIFQLYTLSIGSIPIVIITLFTQNYLLKRNSLSANEISDKLNISESSAINPSNKIVLIAENLKDQVKLEVNNILYIEAEGNYISVVWIEENKVRKNLLRSTLKRIKLKTNSSPYLFQCHRAFIVNIKKITGIKGNAQGYKLNLQSCDFVVPVSRNYINSFNHLAGKIK